MPACTSCTPSGIAGKATPSALASSSARGDVVAIQDADLELDPAQLAMLVAPLLAGETDVVYGSRFLDGTPDAPRLTLIANRTLTSLTNLLFGSAITDMETCYKVMRTSVARSLGLTADRFDIEPEITARLLKAGHTIVERPVTFLPRSRAAGKKIGWRDGVAAVRVLLPAPVLAAHGLMRPLSLPAVRALVFAAIACCAVAIAIAIGGGLTRAARAGRRQIAQPAPSARLSPWCASRWPCGVEPRRCRARSPGTGRSCSGTRGRSPQCSRSARSPQDSTGARSWPADPIPTAT